MRLFAAKCDLQARFIDIQVTWWKGQTLAQTLWSLVWIHKPIEVESTVLRAYLVALLRCVSLVIRIVVEAQNSVEEDFIQDAYGVDLMLQTPLGDIVADLDKAIGALEAASDTPPRLVAHLRYRKTLLVALAHFADTPNVKVDALKENISALQKAMSDVLDAELFYAGGTFS
jgi:hypothetical protein